MLENFIYAKQKSLFEEALNNGEVLDEAIVFIEDTKEIWNHGTYFDGSTVDLSNIEEVVSKIKTDGDGTQFLSDDGEYKGLKTINGEPILGEGDITIGSSESQPMVSTTWAELKAMRDGATLVPGTWYRITDYMTTTSQEGTQSAGHQFDVVVLATGVNTLSEEARAAKHEGDTYFTENGANLDAWKIWYCLDNDKKRFPWAVARKGKSIVLQMDESTNFAAEYVGIYEHEGVTYHRWDAFVEGLHYFFLTVSDNPQVGDTTSFFGAVGMTDAMEVAFPINAVHESYGNDGYGVIYRMVDENHNDVAYDFKNIQFMRDDVFMYTFHFNPESEIHSDFSVNKNCFCNTIKKCLMGLNNNVMKILDESALNGCYFNTFEDNCYANTIGGNCYLNTFGNSCNSNIIGDYCHSNTFGNSCNSNTIGNNCYLNTFGDDCHSNTFGEPLVNEVSGYKLAGGIHDLVLPVEAGRTCETKVAYNSKGELKIYCEADLIN